MSQITASFAKAWIAADLGGYRKASSTYASFDFDTLPPIDERLCGDFAWLTPMHESIRVEMLPHGQDDEGSTRIAANLERIIAEATTLGYTLPDSFVRFMRAESLQRCIPSCTACYFDAPDRIVPAPVPGEGILIRFLNDQQWCVLWYLYVEKNGAHAILASDRALDVTDDVVEADGGDDEPLLYLCAQDFEEFLYRFWLENCAWFVLHEKHRPLSPAEGRYLAHYDK